MDYRGKENLGLSHDPMNEHLRFTSSFHSRPSYGRKPAPSNHHQGGSIGSYSENRGDMNKQSYGSHGSRGSYGSHSVGIPASNSWDSKDSHVSNRSGQTTDSSQCRRIAGGSNYNHNKRISRTKMAQEERSQRSSYGSRSRHEIRREHTVDEEDENFLHTSDNVIALFGAYGTTGQHFLQVALEAGYRVRVLLMPGVELDIPASKNLSIVTGTFDEEQKIERVLKKAAYVVCMLNDCTQIMEEKDDESSTSNYRFVQRLVSILEQVRSKRVLLYQASSVALDNKGSTPMLSSLVKKLHITKAKREALAEQDKIVEYITTQMDQDSCRYIVTRPSDLIWDKPSKRKLAASKSQPGPFSITNIDLAEFSLNALKNERLYNSCPYVVQDY
mmetsp:Transcript_39790/g.96060  ORF Transcript_39790/g.96060 Transcript_39790/m.96060 type:complete len:387 (+) Transcript_39790:61-1221(+)